MEQRFQCEVRPLYFVTILVETIIATVLNSKAERAKHIYATFLILLRDTFLLALLCGIVSLSPDGLVAVHLSQFRDVSLQNGFILDTQEQIARFIDNLLLFLSSPVFIELLLKCP